MSAYLRAGATTEPLHCPQPIAAEACTELGAEPNPPSECTRVLGLTPAGWFWCSYFAALFVSPLVLHACSGAPQ